MSEDKPSVGTKLLNKIASVLDSLGLSKPAVLDTRSKNQWPTAVSQGIGKLHKIMRAFRNGSLASRPYPFIGKLLEKVLVKVAHTAWIQGKEAHPDCENPYQDKS